MFKKIFNRFFGSDSFANGGNPIEKDSTATQTNNSTVSKLCPYCKNEVGEKISKFKCPYCKQIVFVRKENAKSVLLTEEENIEFGKSKIFNSVKKKNFNSLVNNGYDLQQIELDFQNSNVRTLNHLKDFIWHSYNFLLSKYPTDFNKQKLIYYSMSNFSIEYENGKDAERLLKLASDIDLREFSKTIKNNYLSYQIVIIGRKDNKYCAEDNGRIFNIRELIKNPILPHQKDSDKFCSCFYGLEPIRDSNGRLIFKDI